MRALDQLERASQRRRRESIKQFKIQQKQQEISNAAEAVRKYENYIDTLMSVHKEAMDRIEWKEIVEQQAPTAPVRSSANEELAVRKRVNYKPSFFDKLFKSQERQMTRLDKKVVLAREKDEKIFQGQWKKYEEKLNEWQQTQNMAGGVLARDIHTYQRIIEHFQPFSDLAELGSRMNFEFSPDNISIDLFVNSTEIIPREIPTQTSTGKPFRKTMPAGRFNELYQDFVCSCVLRVAREVLACIPIELVVVNALSDVLDTATGITAQRPILSVAFSPKKLAQLNFEALDPSDSMSNFPHRMKFGKTSGFSPVERIDTTGMVLE
jgi:hypothetical protein